MEKESKETIPTQHTQVIAMFFQVVDDLKWHHLNTRSFAEHKALDFAYGEMTDYTDKVSEQTIGLMGRLGTIKLMPVPNCKLLDLPEDIMEAAEALRELGTSNKFPNLVNLADEITGVGAELKYLLTLS
jgi:DNA-binding ferritin-like protein